MNIENAAHNLLGKDLQSGWKVIQKKEKGDNDTGSIFSVCYIVQKEAELAFLKAFNFAAFFQISHQQSMVDVMAEMLNAFKYERDLSNLCRNQKADKVVFVKEAGEETIPGYTIPVVPYLIFDLADGDVRRRLDFSKKLEYAWRLKSLHNISIGLRQLHKINVSHQDLKPSNVLIFQGENSKIGDLGRSMCSDLDAPHLRGFEVYSGDWNYAPPEIMYGYYENDWKKRTQATDCYLLGSLIVFYFSGISMSALLTKHIPSNFLWTNWKGTFDGIKDYLLNGFQLAIEEFSSNIQDDFFKHELTEMVKQLCYPISEQRGHKKTLSSNGNTYNLERFISRLDYLKRIAEIKTIKG